MKKLPSISEAEWQVMQIVWGSSPISAAEVVEELADQMDWHPRTIKTMLNRLVKKGALDFKVQGNRYLYRPRVSRRQCIRAESRSFLDRVFNGEAADLLAHVVKHEKLSKIEIDQLRKILNERRR